MKFIQSIFLGTVLWSGAVVPAWGVVGYVNYTFSAGDNLFGNSLSNLYPNSLSQIFTTPPPDGTTVSPWNSGTRQYLAGSVFTAESGWSINYSLVPGNGALLFAPSEFMNTFVGTVLTGPGPGPEPTPPTPPARGPGLYLLSSLWPADDRTFVDMIGRTPVQGESVTFLNELTQTYSTTTFLGGLWNNGDPLLDIGHAAFYNLGPVEVPEPSALGLLGAATAIAWMARRKRGIAN